MLEELQKRSTTAVKQPSSSNDLLDETLGTLARGATLEDLQSKAWDQYASVSTPEVAPRRVDPVSREHLFRYQELSAARSKKIMQGKMKPTPVTAREVRIYSSAMIQDLESLRLSKMGAPICHRENYLLCRTISKTHYDAGAAMSVIVEDTEGSAALVKLVNYGPLIAAVPEECDFIIPVGTILAIREPSYDFPPSNPDAPDSPALPYVRVDTPSDVVFVQKDDPVLRGVSWSTTLTTSPRPSSGESWRAAGLEQFKKKRWFSCAVAFTNCIKLGYEPQRSRLNRSEAYLRMGWNNSAYHDAKDALGIDGLDDELKTKAVVRMMKARYAQQRYEDVIQTAKELPNDSVVLEWERKATLRLEEQGSPYRDWDALFLAAGDQCGTLDMASFTGPVEARTGSNGLRGVFVTRDVKVGELLMFHKPLCNWTKFDNVAHDLDVGLLHLLLPSGGGTDKRATYLFLCKVIQDVWDDRELYRQILSLQSANGLKSSEPHSPSQNLESMPMEHPTKPVVDIDVGYIQGAISTNSFNHSHNMNGLGLYGLPSLVNHACLPTSLKRFLGDIIVIRASRALKKGEEVTVHYLAEQVSYDERKFRLQRSWKFECTCELCVTEAEDGIQIRESRKQIVKAMSEKQKILESPQGMNNFNVQRLVDQLKVMYADLKKTFNNIQVGTIRGIKHELFQGVRHYSSATIRLALLTKETSLFKLTIELHMEALDYSGLQVLDRSITGRLTQDIGHHPIDLSCLSAENENHVIVTMLQIVTLLFHLKEKVRGQRWLDAALHAGNCYTGGGRDTFKSVYKKTLSAFPEVESLI